MDQRTSIVPLFHYVKFSLTDRWRAKCFHVELAESPSETASAVWSRVTEGNAHSATVRWKHLGFSYTGRVYPVNGVYPKLNAWGHHEAEDVSVAYICKCVYVL